MSIFGAGPQFWEGIAGFTRKMLSPYLRKMPARVQSVQGTAPNQTAVVARADELAALAAGEISEIARPAYPVWGSVVVGQQVWCLVDGAGLHVMGTPGGGGGSTSDLLGAKNAAEALSTYPAGNTIAFGDATTTGWPVTHVLVVTDNRTPFRNQQVIVEQPSGRTWRRVWDPALASGVGAWVGLASLDPTSYIERVYRAPEWATYYPPEQTAWATSTLPEPKITVPALGAPPAGYAWRINVLGAIRILPPNLSMAVLFGVGFDGATNQGVQGGGGLNPSVQTALGIFAYGLTPPATDRSFTVNFTLYTSPSGAIRIAPGPYPTAVCYLVAV